MGMSTTPALNIDRLKEAYESNPKYRAVLDVYSQRQRARQDTTLPRIKRVMHDARVEITATELIQFMQLMQESGAGKWHAGRKPNTGKFIWSFNLKSVADAVKGKQVEVKSPPKSKLKLPIAAVAQPEVQAPVQEETPEIATPLVQFSAEAFPANTSMQHRSLIVRKNGLEIEIHLDELTQDDLKNTAILLSHLTA